MRQKILHSRILLGLVCLLTACASPTTSEGTYVWIDAPINDLSLPVGDIVTIDGHASNTEGIAQIEIWINGELYITQDDPPQEGNLTHFKHIWVPSEPGDYIVQVIAFGDDGTTSIPDSVILNISDIDTETPVTDTATPTLIATMITTTPTIYPPTNTPRPTWTNTPKPAPDTTAPPPPSPISPTGDQVLSCVSQAKLAWNAVSDPSGIDEYRVQVERHSGDNNWQPISGSPFRNLSSTSLNVSVECGWYFRWRVRAVDGAGNVGSFSSWAYFAVTLG
jgi:hypothetical protein